MEFDLPVSKEKFKGQIQVELKFSEEFVPFPHSQPHFKYYIFRFVLRVFMAKYVMLRRKLSEKNLFTVLEFVHHAKFHVKMVFQN